MTNFQLLVKESNKSLTEISQETGISYSTLGNYNQGTRTPKKENAKILADYFGVSIPYLLGLDDNRQILDFAEESLTKGIIEKIKGRKTLDMLLTSTPYLEENVDIMNDIINKKVLDSYIDFLYEGKYPPAVIEFIKDVIKNRFDDIPALANRSSDKNSEYHSLWEAWEKEPRRKERLEQTRKKWKEQGIPIFKSWK
ncbi:TPA: helix-turn-helix transcriptional regulator [Streptococcus agalactiae]|uniref:helix-turn-helix domain-containing protein n=2 Tax=Streptococcus agalactiae TaxID=1311 RepID=UPI0002BA1866|nr:helix-turn-helix transcriptional regulator [Streptococcus agalactiae]ASA91488.1 transcriptional regulator [Streptococcus agalactiae]EPU65124.1 Cro/Cl family transcriptional regulator [Streptococcus agalactiae GB00083]EPU67678.1 Cro/Cl family transcriptional regulator [Streptococcus agalactiae GB00083]EPU68338.1 Cro/Cl family transcriptional regulator [Streptococcus agalactiae GB00083]KAA8981413.1 helix-turn-helix transcriptional regulator [Streptococcus agalactiae]